MELQQLGTVIWLSGALLILVASIIVAAWTRESMLGLVLPILMLATWWPVLLGFVLIIAPFCILYLLVSWFRDLYEDKFED